jgi:hypothetical protein
MLTGDTLFLSDYLSTHYTLHSSDCTLRIANFAQHATKTVVVLFSVARTTNFCIFPPLTLNLIYQSQSPLLSSFINHQLQFSCLLYSTLSGSNPPIIGATARRNITKQIVRYVYTHNRCRLNSTWPVPSQVLPD